MNNMKDDYCAKPQVESVGEVTHNMEVLKGLIYNNNELVSALAEKLWSVIAECPTDTEGGLAKTASMETSLGRNIRDRCDDLLVSNNKLKDIISKLRL